MAVWFRNSSKVKFHLPRKDFIVCFIKMWSVIIGSALVLAAILTGTLFLISLLE